MLDIDLKMAERFLTLLDESAEEFTFQTFNDNKSERGARDILAKTFHGSFEDVKEELVKYNNLGAGIYICVNQTDLKGIKKENITGIRAYFAEADGNVVSDWRMEPSFEVQSKNGMHTYWLLKDIENVDVVEFEKLQAEIARVHKTDVAVKNVNRVLRLPGFFHLKDKGQPFKVRLCMDSEALYASNFIRNMYPLQGRGRPVAESLKDLREKRGMLLPSVDEYFKKGWAETPGNGGVIHSAANCKKNNFTEEECIVLFESKGEELDRNTLNQIKAVYKSSQYDVNPYFQPKKGGQLEETILNSKLYRNALGSSATYYVVDKTNLKYIEVAKDVCHSIVGKKNLKDAIKVVIPEYAPEVKALDFVDEFGYDKFNLYQPPEWLAHKFYLGVEIEPEHDMPVEYKNVFEHIFGHHRESYEYVLDWLAYSLRSKNITILSLIGSARGIGKGVISDIAVALHGKSNAEKCKQTILSKEFNSQMLNKTLAIFDEVSIIKESEFESIKAYTNNSAAIEGKGLDAQTCKLFTSIILTNNSMGCLAGVKTQDDRQFSVPEMTTTPLNQSKKIDIARINRLFEDKQLIDRLARYLYTRDLSNFNPTINLKSPHYFNVVRNSKVEWNYFLVENFALKHQNCGLSYMLVKQMIKEREGVAVGRAKFDALCYEYNNVIATKYFNNIKMVFFAKEGESVSAFQDRVRLATPENKQGFDILTLPRPLID